MSASVLASVCSLTLGTGNVSLWPIEHGNAHSIGFLVAGVFDANVVSTWSANIQLPARKLPWEFSDENWVTVGSDF